MDTVNYETQRLIGALNAVVEPQNGGSDEKKKRSKRRLTDVDDEDDYDVKNHSPTNPASQTSQFRNMESPNLKKNSVPVYYNG